MAAIAAVDVALWDIKAKLLAEFHRTFFLVVLRAGVAGQCNRAVVVSNACRHHER
jgi:hypothetical protein